MNTVKHPFYVRLALTLLSVVLILFLLSIAANIFIPLLFALLVAILLLPLNKLLEKQLRLGRALAPLVSISFFITSMSGFIYFIALQVVMFSDDIPVLKQRFTEMFESLQHWLSHKLLITTTQQTTYINKSMSGLFDAAGHSAGNIFFSVSGVLLLLVFVFIFTFFMLYYRRLLLRFALNLFSEEHREKVTEVVMESRTMINAYISGLVIEMFLMGIVTCALFLVMGIKYPLLLAAMVALLNVIPYLGIFTAIAICMLVTFANSSGAVAIQAGTGLYIIHLLDSNILFPRIIGRRVKMNPFVTILAVIVGEQLWGIPGMFLFIPVAGIIKLVCERVEGLKAWSILIGVEERESPPPVINDEGGV